jgi:hypothetical protein
MKADEILRWTHLAEMVSRRKVPDKQEGTGEGLKMVCGQSVLNT